jgi:hypothetical protein
LTIVYSAPEVLYRRERALDLGLAPKCPRTEFVRRELPHRRVLGNDDFVWLASGSG